MSLPGESDSLGFLDRLIDLGLIRDTGSELRLTELGVDFLAGLSAVDHWPDGTPREPVLPR